MKKRLDQKFELLVIVDELFICFDFIRVSKVIFGIQFIFDTNHLTTYGIVTFKRGRCSEE